jgi:chitinase
MRLHKTRALVASSLAALLAAAALLAYQPAAAALVGDATQSVQQECTDPAWSSSAVYVADNRVSHNGHAWRAKWWTQGEEPGTTGQWGVWEDLGPCGDSPPPTIPPPGECTHPAWSSSAVYTGGDRVTHNGRTWRAQWWTQGETPGAADVWADEGACDGEPDPDPTDPPPTDPPPTDPPPPPPGDHMVIGYFANWGVYARNYHVKNIHTSGSAAKLTHIMYAFGNVQNGRCTIGDSYADFDRFYSAAESVDGQADTWDTGALRGNFNQLRKLKDMYPHLKVVWSFGGWTWSGGFGQAAANPTTFANSCYDLVNDPRWADVFDGIDIDWEYPNACGLSCDSSGFTSFRVLMQALKNRFGSQIVSAAITADATSGGKIDAADYGGAAQYVDFYMVMTYDFFGAWAATGPTAPHSPLHSFGGIPIAGFYGDAAIQKLRAKGIPASKLLLGVPFYGRGWTGVSQSSPGGSASGPAPGTYEQGIEDYKVLRNSCPANGTVAGTAYAHCGSQWWSYDTPATIGGKMTYLRNQGLAGAFFWELSGDTTNGELITAISNGL